MARRFLPWDLTYSGPNDKTLLLWGLAYSRRQRQGTSHPGVLPTEALYGKALLTMGSCLQRPSMSGHFLMWGLTYSGPQWQGTFYSGVLPRVALNGEALLTLGCCLQRPSMERHFLLWGLA